MLWRHYLVFVVVAAVFVVSGFLLIGVLGRDHATVMALTRVQRHQ